MSSNESIGWVWGLGVLSIHYFTCLWPEYQTAYSVRRLACLQILIDKRAEVTVLKNKLFILFAILVAIMIRTRDRRVTFSSQAVALDTDFYYQRYIDRIST